MPPERADEIRVWMQKSEHDLAAARRCLGGPEALSDVVVFHCQQAAEKALKAFLTSRGLTFGKTHDLSALVTRCVEIDPAFGNLLRSAQLLTPYAVTFRYPNTVVEPTEGEATDAISAAEEFHELVKAKLDSNS